MVTRGHSWSPCGHSRSLVVTRGHSRSLVVIRGHSWSLVCSFSQDWLATSRGVALVKTSMILWIFKQLTYEYYKSLKEASSEGGLSSVQVTTPITGSHLLENPARYRIYNLLKGVFFHGIEQVEPYIEVKPTTVLTFHSNEQIGPKNPCANQLD